MLLLHSAHHHAEMLRLAQHAHSARRNHFLHRFGDVLRQPLLQLQPAGEHIDDPWNLAQPDHFVFRQIRHVHLAEKRQQVMLAGGKEFDVAHHHHLVAFHLEQSPVHDFVQARLIPASDEPQRALVSMWRLHQSLAIRILADRFQHPPHLRRNRNPSRSQLHYRLFLQFVFHFISSSKTFRPVSMIRTRRSRAASGHPCWSESPIDRARFSVVATTPASAGTSLLRFLWSICCNTRASTHSSSSRRFATCPIPSTGPSTVTSST